MTNEPLGATGLDHHDRDLGVDRVAQGAAGDDELEGRGVTLLEGGVRDPLPVGGVGHTHRTDRSLKGDARDHQGRGGGVDGEDVVGVLLVRTEDRADDLDLVAKALGERRTQRSVDESTDQDGLVRRLALATKERPGDLSRGVRALLDVDGEREEVDAFAHAARRGDGRQQHRVTDAGTTAPSASCAR